MKTRLLFLLCGLYAGFTQAQIEPYTYRREITGIQESWHRISLPDEIFEKIQNSCNDLRIFGFDENQDTLEIPYFLKIYEERLIQNEKNLNILNHSSDKYGYYFTFEIKDTQPINQLFLEFAQDNFDWLASLDGSQDQKSWFRVLKNYRITSIKNEQTSFHFTKLNFPSAQYRYFRVLLSTKTEPILKTARIIQSVSDPGRYKTYPIKWIQKTLDKKNRRSEIIVDLHYAVPVSFIGIKVRDTFDYFRPISIMYLSDSIQTEHGWISNFNALLEDTLNSFESPNFKFTSTKMQRIKLLIDNQDNQPLQFDSILIKGYEHELIARFTKPMSSYLYYGNREAKSPFYDIDRFKDKIPNELKPLKLGDEQTVGKSPDEISGPFIKNKIWLWLIMALVMIFLGWLTLQMIKNKV